MHLKSWFGVVVQTHSMRQMKCKHIFGVEYAIGLAIVKDIDKLPDTG